MERAALGLSPGLRTPPTKSRQRTPRWGQATEHGPGTTHSTSHQPILQSCSSLTTCDLASHIESQHSWFHRDTGIGASAARTAAGDPQIATSADEAIALTRPHTDGRGFRARLARRQRRDRGQTRLVPIAQPRLSPRPDDPAAALPGAAQARGGRDLAAGPDESEQYARRRQRDARFAGRSGRAARARRSRARLLRSRTSRHAGGPQPN